MNYRNLLKILIRLSVIFVLIFIIVIVIFITLYYDKHATNCLNINNKSITEIDYIYNKVKVIPNDSQIAIAIINSDSIEYYGIYRDRDTLKNIYNADFAFEIGSITKLFTAEILAQLILENKIKLEKRIGLYFNSKSNITIKQLANHTSGLPRKPPNIEIPPLKDFLNPYKYYNVKLMNSFIKKSMNEYSSNLNEYRYSNIGFGILGQIFSNVEKKQYETILQERICTPLEMHNTTTDLSKIKDITITPGKFLHISMPHWELNALKGAGAIKSTCEDLSKFVQFQFDTTHQSALLTRQKTFFKKDNIAIGLAWHIIPQKSGKNLYFHNGGTGGYRSSLLVDMEKKKGIVVLSNISVFDKKRGKLIDDICFYLMNL